jgi:hypothetical protein
VRPRIFDVFAARGAFRGNMLALHDCHDHGESERG